MSLMSPGVASFKALYDYDPDANQGEIELREGDICLVQKPVENPLDWLHGKNVRTQEAGSFPGTYVEVLEFDHHVARPPKPPPRHGTLSKQPIENESLKVNGHDIKKISFMKPVWCKQCRDYIWGKGRKSFICTVCSVASHAGCYATFEKHMCNKGNANKIDLEDVMKPIENWGNIEVLQWMAAVKLHPYIITFKEAGITGNMLKNLTQEYLRDTIGIPYELHISNILLCINELLTDVNKIDNEHLKTAFTSQGSNYDGSHQLYEHTFTSSQACDLCEKPMFGLFRQGYICSECGIQCHKSCAMSSLQSCVKYYIRGRRSSDPEDPAFVCCYKTPIIPPVLEKCVNWIDRTGLGTPGLYNSHGPYEIWFALRAALNQAPENVNMNDSYWNSPVCIASVLKSFLLELPEPLIPHMYFQDFVATSEIEYGPSQRHPAYLHMKQAINTQREADNSLVHLDFLLEHFARICQQENLNGMNSNILGREFGFILLRPTDQDINLFVENLDNASRVITALINECLKRTDEPNIRTLPQRTPVQADPSDLSNQEWFWGSISRKEASELLQGKEDGSFLVRNSQKQTGEWTLTVKKGGNDKLIKIMQRDGRYGFREDDLKYSSVQDLIKFFRENSLEMYNSKLNVRLMYPITRDDLTPIENADALNPEELSEKYHAVDIKLKKLKGLEAQAHEKEQMLEEVKCLSQSQTEVVYFIEEQIQLAEQQFKESALTDREILQQSLSILNQLLHHEKQMWQELDDELSEAKKEYNYFNTQLMESKDEIPDLEMEWNKLELKMRQTGHFIGGGEEEDELIYDVVPANFRAEALQDDSLEEASWLFKEVVPRKKIHEMLDDKPDGTFFVRPSERCPENYVISLMYSSGIVHVPIERGPRGYGFAEPHNIYPTIKDLVNHYHSQSLRMHNSSLDTALLFPLRYLEQEDIYETADILV